MLVSRRILRTSYPPIRTLFTPRNDYETGDGVKLINEVYGRKPEENPADYTLTGKKRKDHWHYSDRKAGKGYTDFNNSPFIHRQYIFPPLRGDFKRAPFIIFGLMLPIFVDFKWVLYHIRNQVVKVWPEFDEWLNENFVQLGDTDDFD